MKKKCKSHCADSHKIKSGLGLAAVRGPPRSVAERTRRRLTSRGRGARRDCGGALLRRSSLTGRHTSKSICGGHGQSIATGTPPPGTEAGGAGGFPRHTEGGTTVSTSLLCRRGDGQGRKYRRRAKGSQKARTQKLAFFGPRVDREGEALNKATLPYRDGGHEPPGLFKFVKIK